MRLTQRVIAAVVYLPATSMILDLIENVTLLGALGRFPDIPEFWITIGSMSTVRKLTMTVAVGVVVLVALAAWGAMALRQLRRAGEG